MEDNWVITYTDVRTGYRERYLDIGFDTPEEARDELNIILKQAKKHRQYNWNLFDRVPITAIGKYWRIKKIKITPVNKKQ